MLSQGKPWSGLVRFDWLLVLHGEEEEYEQYSVFVGLDWLKLFACPASASPGCQQDWSVLEGRWPAVLYKS